MSVCKKPWKDREKEKKKTPERLLATSEQTKEEGLLESATSSVWASDCSVIYKDFRWHMSLL